MRNPNAENRDRNTGKTGCIENCSNICQSKERAGGISFKTSGICTYLSYNNEQLELLH